MWIFRAEHPGGGGGGGEEPVQRPWGMFVEQHRGQRGQMERPSWRVERNEIGDVPRA